MVVHIYITMQVPNRIHNSGKEQKRKLKPQAMRARRAALKALKAKLQLTADTMRMSDEHWSLGEGDD